MNDKCFAGEQRIRVNAQRPLTFMCIGAGARGGASRIGNSLFSGLKMSGRLGLRRPRLELKAIEVCPPKTLQRAEERFFAAGGKERPKEIFRPPARKKPRFFLAFVEKYAA